jgi:excisionase family DNA binding protein
MSVLEKYLPESDASILQLARLWGCSEMMIRTAIAQGKLTAVKLSSNRRRIYRESAKEYLLKYGLPKAFKSTGPKLV